jgi:hypothetical protein
MTKAGDIEYWDALVAELVPELTQLVGIIADAISPNGARWGLEKKPLHDQLMEYMGNLRGNPDAWMNWIRTRVKAIEDTLQGIDPKLVTGVHPYSIAEAHAYAYSVKMERLWKKEIEAATEAAGKEVAEPTTPPVMSGVEYGSPSGRRP